MVACIQHATKVAGIDHVRIGADFDGITSVPQGLEDVSKIPALRQALAKTGYSETDRRVKGQPRGRITVLS